MRRAGAALVLATMLTAAGIGLAQDPGTPTDLWSSRCYECHATGGGSYGPPLRSMFSIHAASETAAPFGSATPFQVTVVNDWNAALDGWQVSLDLGGAPSLGFSAGQDPIEEQHAGELASALPVAAREARVDLRVPSNTTDLRIAVAPAAPAGVAALAPDLALHLWPPGHDRGLAAPIVVDDAGEGGTEAFVVHGAAGVAELGLGTWQAAVVQAPAVAMVGVGSGAAGLVPQGFTFSLGAWFNATGETVQFVQSDVVLEGLDATRPRHIGFAWALVADAPPHDGAEVVVSVAAHAYYEPSTAAVDDWWFVDDVRIPVAARPGGYALVAGRAPAGGDPLPALPGVSLDRIAEVVGYVSAMLIVASLYTGGILGKASRRHLNTIFHSAKRRVAFHNFLSYGLTLAATAHATMFVVETRYHWALGLLWGGLGILAMLALGLTGALQVPMIRRSGYGTWRWAHFASALAAVVFTVLHMLLDGVNFADVQQAVGWQDPLVPRGP